MVLCVVELAMFVMDGAAWSGGHYYLFWQEWSDGGDCLVVADVQE